jgi:hypothetical protein
MDVKESGTHKGLAYGCVMKVKSRVVNEEEGTRPSPTKFR